MILDTTQFLDYIERKESKAVHFYEGHSDLNERPFERMAFESNKELLAELKIFASSYPDKFTVFCHTTKGAVTSNGYTMKVDLRNIAQAEIIPEPARGESEASIKARIVKEVAIEAKLKETEQERDDAIAVNKKNDESGEKLAMLLMHIANQMGFNMNAASMMQGTPEAAPTAAPGTPAAAPAKVASMTFIESKEYLIKVLGKPTFVGLAKKLQKEPVLIESIKDFAK